MPESPLLVQFGAGAIGRSFIGQLFARAGFEVVFVDVNPELVQALNTRRRYRVEIRDTPPGEILVENVRAIDGRDREGVVAELKRARLVATAVGAGVLPAIAPTLAAGIAARREARLAPLDIVLCENLHHAAQVLRTQLCQHLPAGFPLDQAAGLVETSIGKMVPLVPEAERLKDPLRVFAESFNTLIVDARGFLNPIPLVGGLSPQRNMAAYVDRKLYVHNLGHAAVAYHAARYHPEVSTIGEAVRLPEVQLLAASAMRESAAALLRAYPGEWAVTEMEDHVQDLLRRFANPTLGDTVYRVGRDVRRKLSRDDRIIGAMRMDLAQGLTPASTAHVAADALHFQAVDESGNPDPADVQFRMQELPLGPEHVLQSVAGLNPTEPTDLEVMRLVLHALSYR